MKRPVGVSRKQVVLSGEYTAVTPFGCGQCIHCLINKARVWTHRICLEARMNLNNCFVTLTYDEDHIPDPPHVSIPHLQKYLKRLRNAVSPTKFRYFAVGEYGNRSWRPHYHLAIFGLGINEKDIIDKQWHEGFTYTGDLNLHSARYISGYVVKGIKGKKAAELGKHREFMLSSRSGGGIGIQAIKRVAERINENEFVEKKVIRCFRYGKKKDLPLGRYLIEKLSDELGLSEEQKKLEFWKYQDQLVMENIDNFGYYDSILIKGRQKRLNQEKRFKIYRKEGAI